MDDTPQDSHEPTEAEIVALAQAHADEVAAEFSNLVASEDRRVSEIGASHPVVDDTPSRVPLLRLLTIDAEPAAPGELPARAPTKHSFRRHDEAAHGWICRDCGEVEEDPVAVHERHDCQEPR